MRPEMEEQLHKISDAAKAAGEAVSSAGDACLAIAVGQIAGVGVTCLDKLFPHGEAEPKEKSGEQESKKQKKNSKHKSEDKTDESKDEHKTAEPKAAPKAKEAKAEDKTESAQDTEPQKEEEPKAANMSDTTDHEALNRKKAEQMAEALSKSVSAPPDPLVATHVDE